jgi:hypothetical protein
MLPTFLENIFLTLLPAIFVFGIGAAFVCVSTRSANEEKSLLYQTVPLAVSLLSLIHLCLLAFGGIRVAALVYFTVFLFSINILRKKYRILNLNIKEVFVSFIPGFLVYILQYETFASAIPPLKLTSEIGTGMDDTAFHAANAAMFKVGFPIPNPFIAGESLQTGHYLTDVVAAFLSTLISRGTLDIYTRTLPFLVMITLSSQLFYYFKEQRKKIVFVLLFVVLVMIGVNSTFCLVPFFGTNVLLHQPEQLPWLFWRLPGLGLSFIFIVPLIDFLTKALYASSFFQKNLFKGLLLVIGAFFAKPVVGICLLSGCGLYLIFKKNTHTKRKILFSACLFIFTGTIIKYLLDKNSYGYDIFDPSKMFNTFVSVFQNLFEQTKLGKASFTKVIFLVFYFITQIAALIIFLLSRGKKDLANSLLFLSGLVGIFLFLVLYSPMGAEYQFGVLGMFLLNIFLYKSLIIQNKEILGCLLLPGFLQTFFFSKENFISQDTYKNPRELRQDIVEAMAYLKNNTKTSAKIFINNQHYRNHQTNNAIYPAISERQTYISCFRYTPGTYINKSKGLPSKYQERLQNNQDIFEGNQSIFIKEKNKYGIEFLVNDLGWPPGNNPSFLQEYPCVFSNKSLVIFNIQKKIYEKKY